LTPGLYVDVSKLTDRDIRGIIEQWKRGRPVRDLAEYHGVTRQRIYQIIAFYRKRGYHPYLRPPGRRPTPITSETEQLVLAAHDRHSLGAVHLEQKIEEESGIHIPHNTIHRVLLTHGRVEVSMKKRKQRKWVRYERDHAMSLWQGDWKQITVGGQKRWLIAFMDDSSRLVTCYGVFDRPTTEYTIQVLEQGFLDYGTPREILTDNGSQFVSSRHPKTANHPFRRFLDYHGIRHITSRVNHPQTNGKIERFFGEVERRVAKFGSVDAVVHWHNEIKPHRSLDFDEPIHAFFYRLPPERILGYAQRWWYAEA
jgi:putative transposase